MNKILIFAGTTEGRELAEFCAAHQIPADVSAATEYGAHLLPEQVGVLTGRLDAEQIGDLLREKRYACVIDATHPYATEVTENIRMACQMQETSYRRLLRKTLPVTGETVSSLAQMIELLNRNDDVILSTLGSKSATELQAVTRFSERIRLRILPSEEAADTLKQLGFQHIIQAKGPFSVDDNIRHIRESGAKILLTKESGAVGGYPEKAEAVRQTGIRMITLCRPQETGFSYEEITAMLLHVQEKQT